MGRLGSLRHCSGQAEPAKFTVRVQPGAKKNKLVGFKEDVLQVRVAAPPVEGKANESLIKFLAGCLGVSKSRVSIERGLTGRMKIVAIEDLSQSEAERLIEARLKEDP